MMNVGIGKELSIFLQAVLAGNLVSLVYYALRIARRIVKHSLLIISIEDIIFWLGAGVYLFIQICKSSDGSIRWYFVVGVILGGVITCCLLEKIMKKILRNRGKKSKI